MIDLELSWRQAAGAAAGLAVATVALRAAAEAAAALRRGLHAGDRAGSRPVRAVAVRGLVLRHGARRRAQPVAVDLALRAGHPPAERDRDPAASSCRIRCSSSSSTCTTTSLHFPVLIACLVWLFVWHRGSYGRWRTTLAAFTGISLLVQLIPVAPPRMLPGTGLVDTAVIYHQSVYSNVAGFDPDQLSAMPSVHVGWAILVAIAVIMHSAQPMALAGRAVPGHDDAGRRRDRQPFLAGRHRRRCHPRSRAGGSDAWSRRLLAARRRHRPAAEAGPAPADDAAMAARHQ